MSTLDDDGGQGMDDPAERVRLMEAVVNLGVDAIVVTAFDEDGEPAIAFVNGTFTEQTGWEPDEVLGHHPRLLVGPATDLEPQLALRQAVEEGRATTVELVHHRKDGSTFWVENTVNPVSDDIGRCTHVVSFQRDITDRKAAEADLVAALAAHEQATAALAHRATHDDLTGLPNRSLAAERLRFALRSLKEEVDGVAVLAVGIDRLDAVYDAEGHDVGDAVVVALATRLRLGLDASSDMVAHLGGGAFTVISESVKDVHAAQALAEAVGRLVDAPCPVPGGEVFLTASIGITLATSPGARPERLLDDAATAMRWASERGAGRHEVFDPALRERVVERSQLESGLNRAVRQAGLTLHYQPIVEVATGQVTGVEALARWSDPELGQVMPDVFIPVAEQTGLIGAIGTWALEEALGQLAAWRADGAVGPGFSMAVNLSAHQLHDRIVDEVLGALDRLAVAPSDLCLEVTESAAMADVDVGLSVLRTLREAGVRIAIDDFGTGQSSLAQLQRMPIDVFKIDRSLTADVERSDQPIAAMVVGLAQSLGVTVVAEGVETDSQLRRLRDLGCDRVQGYLLGRPQPAERLPASAAGAVGSEVAPAHRPAADPGEGEDRRSG